MQTGSWVTRSSLITPRYNLYSCAAQGRIYIFGGSVGQGFGGAATDSVEAYHPAADRVEKPDMPDWCAYWPQSVETSADFDWASIFNC